MYISHFYMVQSQAPGNTQVWFEPVVQPKSQNPHLVLEIIVAGKTHFLFEAYTIFLKFRNLLQKIEPILIILFL